MEMIKKETQLIEIVKSLDFALQMAGGSILAYDEKTTAYELLEKLAPNNIRFVFTKVKEN